MRPETLVVCQYCDAVYRREPLPAGGSALCQRCDGPLYRCRRLGLDATIALALAALVAFMIANVFPLMTLSVQGASNAGTLWTAVLAMDRDGYAEIAVLVALLVFFAPLLQILTLLYVAVPLRLRRRPPGFIQAMHGLRYLRYWGMVEVFLLGLLVASVKLAGMAVVHPGLGLWGYAALTVLMTVLIADDPRPLWDLADDVEW